MSESHHGLFLINKSPGMTSHDVVARLRKMLKTSEIGHSGTLDPLAAGVLVLLVGEATKLSSYILEGNKSYKLEMELGKITDTLDVTGKILHENEVRVSDQEILQNLPEFEGEKEWSVPIYSAVKVKGQKLYEYARGDQEVTPPKKIMKFWDVEFLEREDRRIRLHLHCSKGSYIRTWVDEFGKKLGCGAAMSQLTRTSSQPFRLNQTQTLEELEVSLNQKETPRCFVPLKEALPEAREFMVRGQDERLLRNGQISHDLKLRLIRDFDPQRDRVALIHSSDELRPLALLGLETGRGFVIRRVFHFDRPQQKR